jgi:malate dehydrogenase
MRGNAAQQMLRLAFQQARDMASKAPKERKVAVLGAAGGIGQPLSLLMKVRRRRANSTISSHSSR